MFPGRDPHGVALMKTENASVISNHALKFYFLNSLNMVSAKLVSS